MNGKVAIVSLRFNAAFLQHMIAYAKAVTELGMQATFVLDTVYRRFAELEAVAPIIGRAEALTVNDWTHAIFFNVAKENRMAAGALKRGGAKVYCLYHEPWQMSAAYLRNEGLSATVKAALAHRMTVPLLRMADMVILQSQCGLRIYRQADARYSPSAVYIPLMYDDDAGKERNGAATEKQYFSFIGNPCRAHGFDQYVEAIRYACAAGRDLRFLIASRHAAPSSLMKDPILRAHSDQIELRCGRPLSNSEMNRCYEESFCIWNVYRRSTQSGVLPKAYMFGTPVIASRIGSFPEYVQEGMTGLFADGSEAHEVISGVERIRENLSSLGAICRKEFLETFYYRSRLEDLRQVLS
ncbi:MAG TPA: glycosyltransferase [Acidobacteriaceae bacterium]|nr:glycosyltransferase [Acidobacteriaceae bacterium]